MYRLAASRGDATSQNNLGAIYDKGNGVAQDYVEAVKWYRKAADQGFAQAQANLGLCTSTGGASRRIMSTHTCGLTLQRHDFSLQKPGALIGRRKSESLQPRR